MAESNGDARSDDHGAGGDGEEGPDLEQSARGPSLLAGQSIRLSIHHAKAPFPVNLELQPNVSHTDASSLSIYWDIPRSNEVSLERGVEWANRLGLDVDCAPE